MSLRAGIRHHVHARRSVIRLLAGLVVLAGVSIAFPVLQAGAVHDTGYFALDGTIVDSGTPSSSVLPPGTSPYNFEWSDLFSGSPPSPTSKIGGSSMFLSGAFAVDYPTPDPSYFTSNGGGVKDINPISTWGCKIQSNPTAKDDLLNAYATLAQMPVDATDNAGDEVLYVASERSSNNGNSFAGFWLLQQPLTCNPDGTFTGGHSNGDLLVVSNYTNGGGTQAVNVYAWESGQLVPVTNGGICATPSPPSSNDQACAIANSATTSPATNGTIGTPWPPGNTSATGTGQPYALEPQTFVEAGVDLTAIYQDLASTYDTPDSIPCTADFLAETRSSQQLSATLKDYALTSFATCPATVNTTIEDSSNTPVTSVTLGTVVHDQATLVAPAGSTLPPGGGGGTVTYQVFADSTCQTPLGVFPDSASSSQVTVAPDWTVPPSASVTLPSTTTPTTPYYFEATYSGGSSYLGASSGCTAEPLQVTPAPSMIVTTQQPSSAALGATLNDKATLSQLVNPVTTGQHTGTITFNLYDVNDQNCAPQTGEPVYTDVVPATANGDYYTASQGDNSGGYTANLQGTWHWVAVYSGDANNLGSASTCASEPVGVPQAAPGFSTTPTPQSLTVGTGSFQDSATVGSTGSPGYYPAAALPPPATGAGTVTFSLYQFQLGTTLTTSSCVTGALVVNNVPGTLTNSGLLSATYTSPPYTPTQAGLYQWTASYSGNFNNAATSSGCDIPAEQVTVNQATPGISTTASVGPVIIGNGNTFSDEASVTGGYYPAAGTGQDGTVTFGLYGPFGSPAVATCDATTAVLLPSGFVDVPANQPPGATSATYDSPSYTPTAVGTYYWVATYNGNVNNEVANETAPGTCPGSAELVTVNPVKPAIASTILLSDKVQLSAVSGAGTLGGTVTFTLTGPYTGAPNCTGTVVSGTGITNPETVTLSDTTTSVTAQTSTPIPVAAGTYAWQVTYTPPTSGSNYAMTSTSCTEEEATIAYGTGSPIGSS